MKVTLNALGEMFEAARGIMKWLGDCAKVCFFLQPILPSQLCMILMILYLLSRITDY